MSDDKFKLAFSSNLKRYMSLYNKTQSDIIRDLGFDKSAVSTWVKGTRLPRMDKVNALANYFHCTRSDLIEAHDASPAQPSPNLTPEGYQIGLAYDNADYITKRMVERSLGLESEKEKEGGSCTG